MEPLGPSLFSSLLVIAVSFLPIFALQAQEGKLFHPLAWTKTLAMLSAALVSITVAPVLIWLLVRGRVRTEHVGAEIERALKGVEGTRSVYAERSQGGSYVDFEPDRERIARYNLNVGEVLDVVETAIGGMEIAQTIEGRERTSSPEAFRPGT